MLRVLAFGIVNSFFSEARGAPVNQITCVWTLVSLANQIMLDEPSEWPWYGEAATLDWAADYPLHDAAEQGDATLVRALLHSRANPSLAEPQRGWTPLQYGAACGSNLCHIHIVYLILLP